MTRGTPPVITHNGTRLLAVNSPNATLSVFQLTAGEPVLTAETPVGLEPVSVAARDDRGPVFGSPAPLAIRPSGRLN